MVGTARLKRAGLRLAALVAAVIVLHFVALHWLSRELVSSSVLKAMPPPMFTRLLQQAAAPPPPAPAAATQAALRPRHAQARSVPASSARAAASKPKDMAEQRQPHAPATDVAVAAASPSPPASAPASMPASAPLPESPSSAASGPQPAANPASSPAIGATPSAVASTNLDSWPADTRLNYRLGGQFRSGELHGSARVQWLRRDDKYEAKVDIDVTLLARLVLTSQGEVTTQGLFPRVYEELRGSGPRSARFTDDSIVLNDGRSVPRPPQVQDTASQFVELSHRFSSGMESLQVGRSVSFWLARPGGADLWTYDIVERETLRTPQLGDVDAFHLKPRPLANPRGNITAEMWFAPSLQYLPVRIKVTMGEDTYVDLMVDRIEQR